MDSTNRWTDAAAAVRWNVHPFIDGRYRASRSEQTFGNLNPATERSLCEVAVGAATDIDDAVRVARQRIDEGCWSELPAPRRGEVLAKLADLIVKHAAELALLDTLEMGKPIQAALRDCTAFAPMFLRSAASLADKLSGECAPSTPGSIAFNTFEPRGVVGLITPWNFPIVNAAIKLGPALAVGNTVILKPSELAASSALRLAELALQAGVPPGVFNVVPGLGSTAGAALAAHSAVDMISFTGSTVTGRKVMELAGRSNGKALQLECGGKCPQVVFDDVRDLDFLAAEIVRSVLWNQGQVCSAHTRLVVHQAVKDPLLSRVVKLASTYRPADPLEETTTFGPLASPAQRDRVGSYVRQGLAAGAEPALLGPIQSSGGCYVAPTIFDRVRTDMTIAREEIFGPVLCVQVFHGDDEALALANATDYGLAATIWTRDMARAKRFARAVRAGSLGVRTGGAEDSDSGAMLSHAPQKASGFGSETGIHGLQAYATLKSVTFSGV